LWQQLRVVRRDAQHVRRAHARSHERLVRVAKCRIGDQRDLAVSHELSNSLRAIPIEDLPYAIGRLLQPDGRSSWPLQHPRHLASGNLGIAVHDNLADVVQQLRTMVAIGSQFEQIR
jgi:uncharacterized membrane protein